MALRNVGAGAQTISINVFIDQDVDVSVSIPEQWVEVTQTAVVRDDNNRGKTITYDVTVEENPFQVGRIVIIEFIGETECVDTLTLTQGAAAAKEPEPEPVPGCTDPAATNYNPLATTDDGSCNYFVAVEGCTDPNATNYNPNANVDDGSCTYPPAEPTPPPIAEVCGTMRVDLSTIRYEVGERSRIVRVTTGNDVSIQATDNASWISVSPANYSGNGTFGSNTEEFTISVSENRSTSSRSGRVTFSSPGSGCQVSVNVIQEGELEEIPVLIPTFCYLIVSLNSNITQRFTYTDVNGITRSVTLGGLQGANVCAQENTIVSQTGGIEDTDWEVTKKGGCANTDACGVYVPPVVEPSCERYRITNNGSTDATVSYRLCEASGLTTITLRARNQVTKCLDQTPIVPPNVSYQLISNCDDTSAVEGCKDPNATNFNQNADNDNGTCSFPAPDPVEDQPSFGGGGTGGGEGEDSGEDVVLLGQVTLGYSDASVARQFEAADTLCTRRPLTRIVYFDRSRYPVFSIGQTPIFAAESLNELSVTGWYIIPGTTQCHYWGGIEWIDSTNLGVFDCSEYDNPPGDGLFDGGGFKF